MAALFIFPIANKRKYMNETDTSRLVEVFHGSLWEAELVKTLLADGGIPSTLKDGLVANVVLPAAAVQVRVLVHEASFEPAMVIVREFEEKRFL